MGLLSPKFYAIPETTISEINAYN